MFRQEDGGLKPGATVPAAEGCSPGASAPRQLYASKARGLEPDTAAPRQLKPGAAAPRQFFKKPGGPKPGVPASQLKDQNLLPGAPEPQQR